MFLKAVGGKNDEKIRIIIFNDLFFRDVLSDDCTWTDYAVEMIPEDAIRLRILANSNDMKDQQMKYTVRDEVNAYLSTEISQVTSIDEARKRMEEILPK